MLFTHDLDSEHFPDPDALQEKFRELEQSGFHALEELKSTGEVRAIGSGVNWRGTINAFLDRYPLDAFLVASRYTLLDQGILEDELPRLRDAGGSLVIGGVFNSGILATGASGAARHEYGKAPAGILDRVRRIEAVAARHGVPLPTAAMRFPFGFPAVASVICGPAKPAGIRQNAALFDHPIPDDFWAELKAAGLLPAHVPVPAALP